MNQFMLSRGCVPVDELLVFLQNIYTGVEFDDEKVFRIVQMVNSNLKEFNLMIRSTMDEITTKKFYILISTVDNEITRASSLYSQKQLEFFKLILQAVVHEPRGIISHSDLKLLADRATLPTTSKSRGQLPEFKTVFNEWCLKNWFTVVTENEGEYITLGVRSVAELDVFIKQKLVEKAEDLNCKGCDSLSIYSSFCDSCDTRYHTRCAKMYIDRTTNKCRSCPK